MNTSKLYDRWIIGAVKVTMLRLYENLYRVERVRDVNFGG